MNWEGSDKKCTWTYLWIDETWTKHLLQVDEQNGRNNARSVNELIRNELIRAETKWKKLNKKLTALK